VRSFGKAKHEASTMRITSTTEKASLTKVEKENLKMDKWINGY
jgi:hypothetical protein